MNIFVTEEGGLTGLGYGLCIALAVIAFLAAIIIASKASSKKKPMNAKQLAFCALALALGVATSFIKLFSLPFGGSVTLFSMLFIVLAAYWYGIGPGLLVAFAFGVLQFIQEPYVLSFFQVCCDYLFAFTALGLAGLFWKKKHGLLIGYIVGVLARGAFHALGGYLYWMDYMPESFPTSLAALYPIIYNYSFLLAEAVITVIIILIPPVRKALDKVKAMAVR